MGLFRKKQSGPTPEEEAQAAAQSAFDEQYREELRQIGREQFRQAISAQTAHLEQEVDAMMQRVTDDLKEYATKHLDLTIGRLNTEITKQLGERINDYTRVSGEAQELVTQSLTRNTQQVYEKYQQMSANLQQVVSSQEVQMVTVFQDNKSRVAAMQSEQERILQSLRESEEKTRAAAEQMTQAVRQNVSSQATKLTAVYQENLDRVVQTRDAQAAMLETLTQSTQALQGQYQQLAQLLDKSIADQKAMVAELINDNMSRIVEHYLVGALGEQSDLRAQLPSILRQMEEHKQDMVEDMKL